MKKEHTRPARTGALSEPRTSDVLETFKMIAVAVAVVVVVIVVVVFPSAAALAGNFRLRRQS